MVMEEQISSAIVRSFFKKLESHLAVDVAVVGAGPSGLVAARDLAKLCCALVKTDGALRFTSVAARTVTAGNGKKLALATHNYFLPGSRDKYGLARPVPGCDGLKTGYTRASGSSIALTAARNGRRVVVVILGSAGRHEREAAANRIFRDALDAVSVW